MACGIRKIGITLQVILYIANSAAWIVSILSFTCGFVIGLSNRTIRIDLQLLDLGMTTPATVFIIYGLLLTFVTTVGCFSSLSAKIYLSVFYVALIVAYFIFDGVSGFWLLLQDQSISDFYARLNQSMDGYGDENAKRFGIFPLPPTVYWEHLQRRGQCCGLESFEDWRATTYGRKMFSVPDSCCNAEFSYRYCGSQLLKHPDKEGHSLIDILHPKGCMYIFPEGLRLDPAKKVTYIGRFVGCLLIVCAVLTLVILALVLTKKFKPDQGLNNPDYIEIEKNPPDQGEVTEDESIDEQPAKPSILDKMRNRKVHPSDHPEGGDRHYEPHHQDGKGRRKTLKFKEDGPQYIPTDDEGN